MRSVGMPLLESACGGLRGWERRVPALLLLQTGQSVGYSSIIRDAVSVGVEGRCYSIGMYVSKDWGDIRHRRSETLDVLQRVPYVGILRSRPLVL